jgi:trimeric autotransporter adhesin
VKPIVVVSLLLRICVGLALLLTAGVTAVDTQQYVISTYAGGAPALPTAALSMAADANGNLYFVDGYGYGGYFRTAALSNSVFKIDPNGVVTRIAGNSRTGFSGDGEAATSASLYSPHAVAADRAGNVFIADRANHRVRRVSPDGIITTVAGGGTVLGDGGPATRAQLNYPGSLALDSRGNLFIGELGRVRKVAPDGTITTVAGGGLNSPRDGGSAIHSNLSGGVSVAVDGNGNLFIAEEDYDAETDTYRPRLDKVSAEGTISTLPPVPFCCAGDIAADAAGNLFVSTGPDIWKISPSGVQTVVAGNGTYGSLSGDGQLATKVALSGPTAVAVDLTGDLLVADNFGRSIRKITPDGIIRSVASIASSTSIASGDGGPAINAQLQLAVTGLVAQSGLAADNAGNLYVAETGAHRVRKVSSSGIITTVAGVGRSRCVAEAVCLPLGDGGPAIKCRSRPRRQPLHRRFLESARAQSFPGRNHHNCRRQWNFAVMAARHNRRRRRYQHSVTPNRRRRG